LLAIRAEPSVVRWWGEPGEEPLAEDEETVVLVIDVGGVVAGAIQYAEEVDPQYRHASVDVYISERFQGRGLGTEALEIDRAIRAYENVGFRRVGVLRRYERGADGTFHDGLLLDLLREDLR
jgi:aminoglycoside 6'-N-acetyltransferase